MLGSLGDLYSCSSKQSKKIIIKGDVPEIPDGKIYLTEAHYWRIPVDSTEIKDGKFEFQIIPDSNFYPYMASFTFADSLSKMKTGSLMFKNLRSSGFYLEPGITNITQDSSKSFRFPAGGFIIPANISVGKQSGVLLKTNGSFGWIRKPNDPNHSIQLDRVKTTIKHYPFSYFLLSEIFNAKHCYTNDELQSILSLFDKDVRSSRLGDKVRLFLSTRPPKGVSSPNSRALDRKGVPQDIFSRSAKINVAVFWASWCVPCRKEIPYLKKIYDSLRSDPSITMTSISLDSDHSQWINALESEKMPWRQLIIDSTELEAYNARYDFNAIPLILVLDNKLQEKIRIPDFQPDHFSSLVENVRKLAK
jgi:thiol-disulfide isomerase/thioredoxin